MKKITISIFLVLMVLGGCSKDAEDDNAPGNGVNKAANLLATGASARDILSDSPFTTLLIEATYVQGFRPTQEAMINFMEFLQERTFKESIAVSYRAVASPGEETLTLAEVAELEEEHRTSFNSGDTLAIYIYFADAPSEEDDPDSGEVTLGAVYRNTSMIVYENTVRELAGQSLLISDADIETATLNHEFGHLFGLVNLGTAMNNPHEDLEAENHCDRAGCLMRAELQFGGGLMSLLEARRLSGKSEAVPELDAECLLDLQANGGR